MAKESLVAARVDGKLRDRIETAAEKLDRPVSSVVRIAVSRYLEEIGV